MALTGDILGEIAASMTASGGVNGSIEFDGQGTDNYNELDNKPSINGVVLTGNKTSDDLGIETGGTDNYNDLSNKPRINSVTLQGNVSDTDLQIDYDHLINKPVIPDISDIEDRLTAIEGDITDIEDDISSINSSLTVVADDIATLKASDLVQNSDITSLKNRVTDAENSITYQSAQISNLEGDTTDLRTDLTAMGLRVDGTEDSIDDLNDIVGDGQQSVGTDLTDAVTQLNSKLNNKSNTLLVESVQQSITVSANSSDTSGTISITKTGYTPIAIVGWNISGSNTGLNATIYGVWLTSTAVRYKIRNTGTSSYTASVDIHILYVKN